MKKYLALILILFPLFSFAAVPAWQIVPKDSHLKFTATQNNAPVTGEFKKFTGEISFDPEQLSASHVKIVVDISSVSDAYNQLTDTLKSEEWFNVKVFPQAVFEADKFIKTGNNSYQATGTLTIRNKAIPVVLNFVQEEYSPTKAIMKGGTTIQRTAFGVGQGEWANTDVVKDDVLIEFNVTAVPK